MSKFYELIGSLTECFIVVRFCNNILEFKNKKLCVLKSLIFFLALTADNILLSQLSGYERISTYLLIAIVFIYNFLFLKGNVFEKIILSLTPTLIILPVNLIILHMFSLVSGKNIQELMTVTGHMRIMILFFSKFLFFLTCELIIKLKSNNDYFLNGYQWGIQLSCFIISFIMTNILWKISENGNTKQTDFIFIYLLIVILNILLYILMAKMQKDNISKERYKIMELKLNSQKEQYINMSKQYNEIKILRHDMKHCFMTISELIDNERYIEIKEYIDNFFEQKIEKSEFIINTGNSIIDAVINNKITVCKKNNIQIKCMIDTQISFKDETDISILLSNMLDNAIRGTQGCQNPLIELTIQNKAGTYLFISVKNRINESVLNSNPNLETSKANNFSHGFGILSIKKIAKKHNGQVEIREESGFFINEILLQI